MKRKTIIFTGFWLGFPKGMESFITPALADIHLLPSNGYPQEQRYSY